MRGSSDRGLAAGCDLREASRRAGISERTCQRRLKDPEFRNKVERANQMVDRAVGTLAYASSAAV